MRILTIGDSVFAGNDEGFTFRSALLEIDPTMTFSGLYTDIAGHMNLAQSGACIHEANQPGRWYSLSDRAEITAIFVFLGFNNYRLNDSFAVMRRAVDDLVRSLEHDMAAPVYFAELYLPNPNYTPWGNRDTQILADYNAHLNNLAQRPRINVVSTSAMRWHMLKDGVHPNQQGFRTLAQAFMGALLAGTS